VVPFLVLAPLFVTSLRGIDLPRCPA